MRSTRLAVLAIGLLALATAPAAAERPDTATIDTASFNPASVVAAPAVTIDSVLVVTHISAFGVSLRGEAMATAVMVATSSERADSATVIRNAYLAERSRLTHAPPADSSAVISMGRYRGSGAPGDTTRTTTARVILNRRST